jgi:hypothetical protein
MFQMSVVVPEVPRRKHQREMVHYSLVGCGSGERPKATVWTQLGLGIIHAVWL